MLVTTLTRAWSLYLKRELSWPEVKSMYDATPAVAYLDRRGVKRLQRKAIERTRHTAFGAAYPQCTATPENQDTFFTTHRCACREGEFVTEIDALPRVDDGPY